MTDQTTRHQMGDEVRAEFEAWVKAERKLEPDSYQIERQGDGYYCDWTDAAWDGWKAARASLPQPTAGSRGKPMERTRPKKKLLTGEDSTKPFLELAKAIMHPSGGRIRSAKLPHVAVVEEDRATSTPAQSVLVEALQFYADPFAWGKAHPDQAERPIPDFYSECDFGQYALNALESVGVGS